MSAERVRMMQRRCLLSLAGGMLSMPAFAQPAGAFDAALEAYGRQRFELAWSGFAALADAGHGEAARIALLMSAHDRRLYGASFVLDAARRQRWLDAAAAASSPNSVLVRRD